MQSDGKILLAGSSNLNFTLIRYNQNGALDATFNGGGKTETSVGSKGSSAGAVAIQSDGKLVVAGEGVENGNRIFVLARYNTDGTLDTTFDGDGIVWTYISGCCYCGFELTIKPYGKIEV